MMSEKSPTPMVAKMPRWKPMPKSAGEFWPDAKTETKKARVQAATLDMGRIVSPWCNRTVGRTGLSFGGLVTGYHLGK